MKLSVSIPEEDVEFLDSYAQTHHIQSRSATLQRAIRLLRSSDLAEDYAGAFNEPAANDQAWDAVIADGLPKN